MDRKRVSKHIFVSILITLSIYFLFPIVYPYITGLYWQTVSQNPIRYGDREFEIPSGWIAKELGGSLYVYVSESHGKGYSANITFAQMDPELYGPHDLTEDELKAKFDGIIDFTTGEGIHGYKLIDVPLPDTVSLCVVRKSDTDPGQLQGNCYASGQVFYYSFEGPPEFLPIIKEIVAKAKKVNSPQEPTAD